MKGWTDVWSRPVWTKVPEVQGPVCAGPFGGLRRHLVPHFGCPRIACPRVAPLQWAPPERRVGGNSEGVKESQEQDPPCSLPRPLVARKTWRRGACPAPLRRTGSSLGMLGAGRRPSSPGGGVSWWGRRRPRKAPPDAQPPLCFRRLLEGLGAFFFSQIFGR